MNEEKENQENEIAAGSFVSPVYKVIAVPVEKVVANDYNPNIVAPPEMQLLELSIWEDGYTMPCVCYYIKEKDQYELVDGYHRYLVLKTSRRIYEREKGLLPVSNILHLTPWKIPVSRYRSSAVRGLSGRCFCHILRNVSRREQGQ